MEAMNKKITALEKNNTWDLVFYHMVKHPLAVNGCTRSNIMQMRALRDVNNDFLHGDIHEEVYMQVTQGYSYSLPSNTVYKLKKSLYGLKQANKQWFEKLTTFLLTLGFKQSYVDTSLFTLNLKQRFITLLVYVDDILIAGNDTTYMQQIKNQLNAKFSIKDLGLLHYYLGIEFFRNKEGLAMTQRKYAIELVKHAGLLDTKPSATSLDPLAKLSIDTGDPLPDPSYYKTLVGKLLYLTITRPNLAFAAQALMTGQAVLSQEDLSSTEAEYRALADTICEVTWLHCFLKEFNVQVPTSVLMMCDNASAISLASNLVYHARTKHIEIDCHFVRDKIKAGQILPTYISTKQQWANILTKGLSKPLHYNCLSKLGMCNPYMLPTYKGDDNTDVSKHPVNHKSKHSICTI
ncbi:retrovirus-related pol polyprotein from transposon TNT 1-94 [Tanacetum coccineum]